jgi:uncharacterized protein YjiS (DUF1127 family)
MMPIGFFFAMLSAWRDRAWGRRQLGRLDARMLQDIGVSRSTAAEEAAKPWWRD